MLGGMYGSDCRLYTWGSVHDSGWLPRSLQVLQDCSAESERQVFGPSLQVNNFSVEVDEYTFIFRDPTDGWELIFVINPN